jgi:hypothetical protein
MSSIIATVVIAAYFFVGWLVAGALEGIMSGLEDATGKAVMAVCWPLVYLLTLLFFVAWVLAAFARWVWTIPERQEW